MLNADVHAKFTNHQYQDLVQNSNSNSNSNSEAEKEYKKRSECSIFFEVDGPYRCMVRYFLLVFEFFLLDFPLKRAKIERVVLARDFSLLEN